MTKKMVGWDGDVRKGHGLWVIIHRDALALWDEKAFGNYIAIRCIDYEHKPAGVGTAM